jgi:hypothetical protein
VVNGSPHAISQPDLMRVQRCNHAMSVAAKGVLQLGVAVFQYKFRHIINRGYLRCLFEVFEPSCCGAVPSYSVLAHTNPGT